MGTAGAWHAGQISVSPGPAIAGTFCQAAPGPRGSATARSIDRALAERLRQFGANVNVERIALIPAQLHEYQLPTRPAKKSDSRTAGFIEQYGDASIELDALPPNVLTALVRGVIERHIDRAAWRRAETIEDLGRETLANAAAVYARLPLGGSIPFEGGQ